MSKRVCLTPRHDRGRDMLASGANPTIDQPGPDTRNRSLHPRQSARRRALQVLADAYGGDTHRLLTDLAQSVGASIAYVDRPTVEAHLERSLSDPEWEAATAQFTAMDLDDHVGDAGSLRTDWIEDVLAKAGVPGRGHSAHGEPVAASPPAGT